MEEVMSLKDEDQVLLTRELGCNVEIKATGFASLAQSPTLDQQGFQRGQQGLALFIRDTQRRNYYITIINFIQQVKVLEVPVTTKLTYWKNPRQTRCHSIKDDDIGGSIGVIFDDQRKADLFYDSVKERIEMIKKKITDRREPQPPSTAKPRNQPLSRPPVVTRPKWLAPGSKSSASPSSEGWKVGHPLPSPELGGVLARPPMLPSSANKPRCIAPVNPLTSPLSTPTLVTIAPSLTYPTTAFISSTLTRTLTSSTVPTTTLTCPSSLDLERKRRSSPIPSTTEPSMLDPSKKRPELLPPSFDNLRGCPKDAATPKSGLFKAKRRMNQPPRGLFANGPELKPPPLLPKVETSTSDHVFHRTRHNGDAAVYLRYQGESHSLHVETVPSHNTPSTQPNRSAPRTHTQTDTNFGQFRLPPLGTGLHQPFSSHVTKMASPSSSRSFNPSVTSQPPTATPQQQEFWRDDTTQPRCYQKSWEPQNQSSSSSSTPSWNPPASQESWKPQNQSSPSSSTPSWAPAQFPGPELPLPRTPSPPSLPPIENLTLCSDPEEFPPPPPPKLSPLQSHSNGVRQRPQHQRTSVQAVDPIGTMLQGLRSNNPLARLRKTGVEQSPSPAASGEGNDMLSSLQQELLKRKKVIQDPIYTGEVESDNEEWDE